MKTVVKNNTLSEHGFRVFPGFKKGSEVKRSKVNPEKFTLRPGVNEVDSALWELAKNKPLVQWRLEEGVYEEHGEHAPNANPLARLKEKDAIKMVVETFSDELLETWSQLEKRAKVKVALKAQLDKLKLPGEK